MSVRNRFSPRVSVVKSVDPKKVRVQAHFKDEVDINSIIRRYGMNPPGRSGEPVFSDFSDLTDFGSKMAEVAKANEIFERLPSRVRNRFHNSIPEFFNFVADPQNHDELVKMNIGFSKASPPAPAPADLPRDVLSKKDGSPKKVPKKEVPE